jgi:hypothetical protein
MIAVFTLPRMYLLSWRVLPGFKKKGLARDFNPGRVTGFFLPFPCRIATVITSPELTVQGVFSCEVQQSSCTPDLRQSSSGKSDGGYGAFRSTIAHIVGGNVKKVREWGECKESTASVRFGRMTNDQVVN